MDVTKTLFICDQRTSATDVGITTENLSIRVFFLSSRSLVCTHVFCLLVHSIQWTIDICERCAGVELSTVSRTGFYDYFIIQYIFKC